MSNTLDLNKIGFYVYFNSNRKNKDDLTSIKTLLETKPNIQVDPKKRGVYYKKDFYEIVCKKIFNSLKRNSEFHSNLNSAYILNTLRTADAILLIETIDTIDDKFICGFATLQFSTDINILRTNLLGFNCDIEGCRQIIVDFLPKFCDDINMLYLSFGGLLLHIGN